MSIFQLDQQLLKYELRENSISTFSFMHQKSVVITDKYIYHIYRIMYMFHCY